MPSAPPTVRYPSLEPSELAYLVHLRGALGPLAPTHRLGNPAPPDRSTVLALDAAGAIDRTAPTRVQGPFDTALDVLTDPEVVLTLRFWTRSTRHETTLYLPGAALGGGAVALIRDEDERLSLTAPLDGRDIVNLLQDHGLDALARADHFPFEAHLDLATAAAWLGVIDHARTRVESQTARADDPAPAGDIIAYVRHWWGILGLDAGLTALPVLTDSPSPPTEDALRDALRTLAQGPLLDVTPRGFVPLGVTRRLIYDGRLPSLGMQWQQAVRDEAGLVLGHRILLLRAGGLALCLDRSVPGHVLARTVTLDPVLDELTDWLTFPIASMVPEPPAPGKAEDRPGERPDASARSCTTCGEAVGEGAAFCTSCGTPVAPARPAFCRQCGAELASDASFCTSCGHRVA